MIYSTLNSKLTYPVYNSYCYPKVAHTKMRVLYFNDGHGQPRKIESQYSAIQEFKLTKPEDGTITEILSAGDNFVGREEKINKAVSAFMDAAGVTATAAGNHEFDVGPDALAILAKDAKYKLLALNLKIPDTHPLSEALSGSIIKEQNGIKYAIIGLTPPDLFSRTKYVKDFDTFKLDNYDETLITVQNELDRLKKQGVDKIIVLSHTGYAFDKRMAQETDGIDVIIGGHSHELLEDVEEGKNLFYSKTGKPVVITQAGKDADNFGILNIEFDKNGDLIKIQNSIGDTHKYHRDFYCTKIVENILGEPVHVGTILNAPPPPKNRLLENNPHANFMADAMKNELNADIGLLNSANIRGVFKPGPIDTIDLDSITPFKNKMTLTPITEKELVDVFQDVIGRTLQNSSNKPGLFACSGLEYTISKSKGKVIKLVYTEKDGSKREIDLDNPNPNKIYNVAIDDFCVSGGDKMHAINKIDQSIAVYDFDKDKLAADYIRKMNKPIDITKLTTRVFFED